MRHVFCGHIFAKIMIVVQIFGFLVCYSPQARAGNEMKEFIMACTYGVLAGTLVGASTLAFESRPGENLSAVARGASLGLYAGIALGVYVVYYVPNLAPPEETGVALRSQIPPLTIYPVFNSNGIDGFAAHWRLAEF